MSPSKPEVRRQGPGLPAAQEAENLSLTWMKGITLNYRSYQSSALSHHTPLSKVHP